MTELICINCPRGCRLLVDEDHDYTVSGNRCPRGAAYGQQELVNPVRVVTTTVKIRNGRHRRVPVKTNAPIPKEKVFAVMAEVAKVEVTSPVHVGDVLVANIAGTGADLVICEEM